MTTSATGAGVGSSGKYSSKELAILANAPSILRANRADTSDFLEASSPPTPSTYINVEPPLPGSHENYVVIITGLNTAGAYVSNMENDANGDFYRFAIISDDEGTCMYIIAKAGSRPSI